MTERKLRIALAQIETSIGNLQENLNKVIQFAEQASSQGAELVIFPELALCGYNLTVIGERLQELSEKSHMVIQELQQVAKRLDIAVICGMPLQKHLPGIVYNSAIVIDSTGEFLGSYDKVNAFGMERYFFRLGDQFPIFTIRGQYKLGVMICYDAGFPEIARILAAKGVEAVICTAAWCKEDEFYWDLNLRSRAVDNLLPVIGVNRVGDEGTIRFHGGSRVVSSNGHILHDAGAEEICSIYDLDLDAFLRTRRHFKHMNDLRIPLYAAQYGLLAD